jgi:hypothetical protein
MESETLEARPLPAPPATLLTYESPRPDLWKSDLPPPGRAAKAFWRLCYLAGRALSKPAPRLYTRPVKRA